MLDNQFDSDPSLHGRPLASTIFQLRPGARYADTVLTPQGGKQGGRIRDSSPWKYVHDAEQRVKKNVGAGNDRAINGRPSTERPVQRA
jgi:hypothetical protein